METKILRVFYDNNALPYKDKELSVHYPIVGGAFLGASGTTEIRFYYSKIGNDSVTWVSVAKLPNGKQGSKVLELGEDTYGKYATLSLSSWYTQAKGDVFIALQGFEGGVNYELDNGIYKIIGTPTIQTTGSIKLAINYAPIGQVPDYNDEYTTYQSILALMGSKLNTIDGIFVVDDINEELSTNYENGQLLFSKVGRTMHLTTEDGFAYYEKVVFVDGYTTLDQDYAQILSSANAIIYDYMTNTPYYYYRQLNGNRLYRAIYIDDTNGVITCNELYYVFNLTTRVCQPSSATYSTYNKTKFDTLLSGKADKATTLAGYGITDAYTKSETDSAIASAVSGIYKYKGSVATYDDLPSSGQEVGDVWNVEDTGNNYAWTGSAWDSLGISVDLSDYYTKLEVNGLLTYYYTKTETDLLLNTKANKATTLAGYSITDAYTKVQVDNKFTNMEEVLNGKCRSIVISYQTTAPTTDAQAQALKKLDGTAFEDLQDFEDYVAYEETAGVCINSSFNSQNAYLNLDYAHYYLITTSNVVIRYVDKISEDLTQVYALSTGDIIIITETEVPDRWFEVDNAYAYVLETTKVDLTNYYTKNSNLLPTTTNTYDLGSSSYTFKDLHLGGTAYLHRELNFDINPSTWFIRANPGNYMYFRAGGNSFLFQGDVRPYENGLFDLGSSGLKWKNVYLSGALRDGNNASYGVKVPDTTNFTANKTIALAENFQTLTQAQYDALVSGGTVDSNVFYFIEEE